MLLADLWKNIEWQYYKKETVFIDSWEQEIVTEALWYVVHYLTTTWYS